MGINTPWDLSNCILGPSRELWAVPPAYREAQVSHGAMPYLCPCRGEQWMAGDSAFSWAQSTQLGQSQPHEDSRLYLHSCWHRSCMNVPFQKQQHQTQRFQNKGLLQTTSAGKADAGLFLEPPAFVLCLNSPPERKWGWKQCLFSYDPKFRDLHGAGPTIIKGFRMNLIWRSELLTTTQSTDPSPSINKTSNFPLWLVNNDKPIKL